MIGSVIVVTALLTLFFTPSAADTAISVVFLVIALPISKPNLPTSAAAPPTVTANLLAVNPAWRIPALISSIEVIKGLDPLANILAVSLSNSGLIIPLVFILVLIAVDVSLISAFISGLNVDLYVSVTSFSNSSEVVLGATFFIWDTNSSCVILPFLADSIIAFLASAISSADLAVASAIAFSLASPAALAPASAAPFIPASFAACPAALAANEAPLSSNPINPFTNLKCSVIDSYIPCTGLDIASSADINLFSPPSNIDLNALPTRSPILPAKPLNSAAKPPPIRNAPSSLSKSFRFSHNDFFFFSSLGFFSPIRVFTYPSIVSNMTGVFLTASSFSSSLFNRSLPSWVLGTILPSVVIVAGISLPAIVIVFSWFSLIDCINLECWSWVRFSLENAWIICNPLMYSSSLSDFNILKASKFLSISLASLVVSLTNLSKSSHKLLRKSSVCCFFSSSVNSFFSSGLGASTLTFTCTGVADWSTVLVGVDTDTSVVCSCTFLSSSFLSSTGNTDSSTLGLFSGVATATSGLVCSCTFVSSFFSSTGITAWEVSGLISGVATATSGLVSSRLTSSFFSSVCITDSSILGLFSGVTMATSGLVSSCLTSSSFFSSTGIIDWEVSGLISGVVIDSVCLIASSLVIILATVSLVSTSADTNILTISFFILSIACGLIIGLIITSFVTPVASGISIWGKVCFNLSVIVFAALSSNFFISSLIFFLAALVALLLNVLPPL